MTAINHIEIWMKLEIDNKTVTNTNIEPKIIDKVLCFNLHSISTICIGFFKSFKNSKYNKPNETKPETKDAKAMFLAYSKNVIL